MSLWSRWTSRIRAIGKETYIRFYPNPGFRIFYRGYEVKWSLFYGFRKGYVSR